MMMMIAKITYIASGPPQLRRFCAYRSVMNDDDDDDEERSAVPLGCTFTRAVIIVVTAEVSSYLEVSRIECCSDTI